MTATETPPTTGFVVIYRWRLHPGKEQLFQEIWSKNTPLIIEKCGGQGSRLHKAEDGTWLAYAQWPDRETWERSYSVPNWEDPDAPQLQDAVAESFPRILLQPVADFLLKTEITAG